MANARIGLEGLAQDLARHRSLVGSSNAVVARELALFEELLCGPQPNSKIRDRLGRAWKDRSFRAYYERPLLLAAALRSEAMATPEHPLAAALAREPPDPDALDLRRLARALDPDRLPIWSTLATRKVQTNDVSRAVAWRWPASVAKSRPLALVDVGCSAGLNLVADALPLVWTDEGGRVLPTFAGPVVARLGFDAEPVDPARPADVAWLRACLWPGDVDRQKRLDDALAAFASAAARGDAPVIERVRARNVIQRLSRIEKAADPSALVLVVQSFVREYLDDSEARPYVRDMNGWLAALPLGRAAWVQMELVGDGREPAAEIVAHASASGPVRIARCGYHPRDIDVERDGFAALREAIEAYTPG